MAWKEGLLANIEARLSATPVAIDALIPDVASGATVQAELDYLPVLAAGTFLHDGEQHFFATHTGISGYYLYTPFMLTKPQGTIVFVNRGFVPFDLKDAKDRPETLNESQVTITGLARQRLDEKPSWAVPENDLEANIYYWKDLDAMAAQASLTGAVAPFFIDVGAPRSPGNLGDWPVSGVTLINLPNNHLQYAVTWYGLALTLIGVVAFFIAGRLRGSKSDNLC